MQSGGLAALLSLLQMLHFFGLRCVIFVEETPSPVRAHLSSGGWKKLPEFTVVTDQKKNAETGLSKCVRRTGCEESTKFRTLQRLCCHEECRTARTAQAKAFALFWQCGAFTGATPFRICSRDAAQRRAISGGAVETDSSGFLTAPYGRPL